MKKSIFKTSVIIGIMIAFMSSCDTENLDEQTNENGETTTTVVDCDLEALLNFEDLVLSATATGGTEPFTFLWSNGNIIEGTTASFTPEDSGNYEVLITDAEGCTATASIELTDGDVISPCEGFAVELSYDNVVLTASASWGTEPYIFQWSTGETASFIIPPTNGNYSVTVTDAQGCTATEAMDIVIADPCDGFIADMSYINQMLTAIPLGGAAPYTFIWSTGETLNTITPADSGTYFVDIVDSNGCTITVSYDVNLDDPCNGFIVDIISLGDIISANASGGVQPYIFLWSNGDMTSGTTSSETIPATPGVYSVIVTDAQGCEITDSITFE